MALDTFTPDDLIERLGWRPSYILNSMISIPEPIELTVLPRKLASSPIGLLDTFPIELLHIILNSLDFQSLSRFVRVCHQAKTLVESLPSYQRIMKHASTALIALSRTRLIKFHTAASLYAALLSDKCVSCQKYAAFLFLPTCERCCYECLQEERSLRVITVRMAEACFGISRKDLGQIPIMLNVPGTYGADGDERRKRVKLVSVKQAMELAISVLGSQEAMESIDVLKNFEKIPLRQFRAAQWLTASGKYRKTPNDSFCGMASITFPSLRPNAEVENGLWCFGCRISYEYYRCYGVYNSDDQLYYEDPILEKVLLAMERQERSRSEFLEHIRDCSGATCVLRQPEIFHTGTCHL